MPHSAAHALTGQYAGPIGAQRTAALAAVKHPEWCDRTRCEVQVGSVRHIGHPYYWNASGDDVEFSLSKFRRDDGPTGYLFGSRHLAVVDTYEIEVFDGDFDALLLARMRVHQAEQESLSATQEIPVVVVAEDVVAVGQEQA